MPKEAKRAEAKKGPHKRKKSLRNDGVLAAAVELAAEALEPIAKPDEIGEYLGMEMLEERLGIHYFVCEKEGYNGWRWSASLARVPRGRSATVCEVALVPDDGALLAPPWVPWAERLRPSDIGEGDTVPYQANDERLDNGDAADIQGDNDKQPDKHAGIEQDDHGCQVETQHQVADEKTNKGTRRRSRKTRSAMAKKKSGVEGADTDDADPDALVYAQRQVTDPTRDTVADDASASHVGEGARAVPDERLKTRVAPQKKRTRVLSKKGRELAIKRWTRAEKQALPKQEEMRSSQYSCADCGFMMRISGPVKSRFGVCANEWSARDGHVVSLNYYCGAHSETDIKTTESQWPQNKPHMDESELEVVFRS